MPTGVISPRQVEPALVERSEQLAALEMHLAAARDGSGRFVLVRGEAGAGKTRLVSTFLARIDGVSPVLVARCESLSTPRPFAALYELVEPLGASLGSLLSSSASRHEVAVWMLREIRSRPSQVLLVEDLHWADDATLDLLRYVAGRIDDAAVMVIATLREDEQPSRSLSSLLGALASMPSVRQLPLPPLSLAGVAQLARDHDIDPGHLHRLTGGNPFFATEVLAAGGDTLPISIRDAIRARTSRLSPDATSALQAAAIIGVSVEPWVLAAVAGEQLPAIDECEAAGLVQKVDRGISFGHEITRMTVLEDLPVIRGIGLHRRALEALRRAGHDDEARLAYHAEGAADSQAVLRHARQAAARALALYAHGEAAEQLQRAMRFAAGLDDAGRLELHENLARALFMRGHLQEADDARTEAIRLSDRLHDALRLGNNLRILARYRLFSQGVSAALPVANQALEVLRPLGDTREMALAYCALGHIYGMDQRSALAAEWSDRALELGRRLGDQEVISYALNNLGTAALFEARSEGREILEESRELARAGRFAEHIDRALINLAEAAVHSHELERAEVLLRDLVEFTSTSQIELCNVNGMWAKVMFDRGRWDEAVGYAERAIRHDRNPVSKAQAGVVLARIAVRRDDRDAAERLRGVEDLLAFSATPDPSVRWLRASLHAEVAWLTGQLASVADELDAAYQLAVDRHDPWAIGDLGRWLWRAGILEGPPSGAAEPYALQMRGEWRQAAGAWERIGVPYEVAICQADSTEPDDLRAAHAQMIELGAVAAVRRVSERLHALGEPVPRGPRRTTRDDPAGLTEREAEVAALVATGLSNAEIAGKLVLADKTVSHHVSAILAKLGVRRRADVAGALRGELRA